MPIDLSDFQRTLILLASGLVELHDQTLHDDPVRSPYPARLEQGMHRLAALQLRAFQTPIGTLQEFLELAHRPLSSWTLDLPEGFTTVNDTLLDKGLPTSFCLQWVHEQGADAFLQEQLLPTVMDICRQAQQPEAYTAFRELLITHPAIDGMSLQQQKMEPLLRLLANQITEAYISAPRSAAQDGMYHLCEHCRGLLLRVEGNVLECENDRCRLYPRRERLRKALPVDQDVKWLNSGLRRYVAQPGLAEIELRDGLKKRGLAVEMWPMFDAYDLRVIVGDEVWAIDVKDWADPVRLAAHAGPIPETPHWDKAFYVFPDERKQQRVDYLQAFKNHWRRPKNTQAMMKRDFMRALRSKLEGTK